MKVGDAKTYRKPAIDTELFTLRTLQDGTRIASFEVKEKSTNIVHSFKVSKFDIKGAWSKAEKRMESIIKKQK